MTSARSLAVWLFAFGLALCAPDAALAKRVALVIGNSAYTHVAELANPRNDAADMAQKLEGLGFEVVRGIDLDLTAMRGTVRDFIKRLEGAELALFYYAGHGLQVEGVNYMAPIDARLESIDDLEFEAMSVDLVVTTMERNTKTNIVFLDACRDNPLAVNLARSMGTRSGTIGRGLARIGTGIGTLISLATQPGNVALDGEGRNSPFTTALLRHLGTPGQDITRDLILVRRDVLEATGGKQVPWDHSSLTGEVVLQEGAPEAAPAPDNSVELAFWASIKDGSDARLFRSYLEQYPEGSFARLARVKIEVIEAEQARLAAEKAATEERERRAAAEAEARRQAEAKAAEEREQQIARLEEARKALEAQEARRAALADEEARKAAEAEKVRKLGILHGVMQGVFEKREAERKAAEAGEPGTAPEGNDIYDSLALRDGAATEPKPGDTSIYDSLQLRPRSVEEPAAAPAMTAEELARATQTELRRVGCLAGRADGIWGRGSEAALKDYAGRQGVELAGLEPSTDLLDRLKATTVRVCPLVCAAGQEERGGRCVAREASLPRAEEKPNEKTSSNANSISANNRTCYLCDQPGTRNVKERICIRSSDTLAAYTNLFATCRRE